MRTLLRRKCATRLAIAEFLQFSGCAKLRNCAFYCAILRTQTWGMKTAPFPRSLAALTPLERHQKISVEKAAALNDVCEQTFRRNYPHLIRKVGRRRDTVELGDAIDLPPPGAKSAAGGAP